jgi:hypothetical protein
VSSGEDDGSSVSEKNKPSGSLGILDEILPELASYYSHLKRATRSGQARRELDRMRTELQGIFKKDEYTDHFPKIAFRSHGLPAALAVWPRSNDFAEFQVNLAVSNPATGSEVLPYPTLELFSHSLTSSVIASKGLQRMTLGDTVIDGTFTLFAADDRPVRQVLDRTARETLLELYFMVSHHTLYLGLEYERAVVKKVLPAASLTADVLREMIRSGRRLVDALLAHLIVERAEPGLVEILEVRLPAEAEARCQVCGERVILDRVECRRCDTPHHRDCWEYNGRCALYACGEVRYRT